MFKVVNSKMNSCVMTGKYALHYELGVEVKPKIGYIFCFKTFEAAKFFCDNGDIVLNCLGTIVDEPCDYVLSNCNQKDHHVELFWNRESSHMQINSVPRETVLCSNVIPISMAHRCERYF